MNQTLSSEIKKQAVEILDKKGKNLAQILHKRKIEKNK